MKYLFIFLPFFAMAQGGDSTLYGVRNNTMFITGERFYLNGFDVKSSGFYVSDRKPKVVESFKHAGAYYELREDGWYKELDTDTLIKPRMMEYAPNGGGDDKWKYCDEHLKEGEIGPWRDSSSVNVLIWDGCKLIQKKVDKFENYTYSGDSFLFKNTLQPIRENYSVQYAYKGRLIKFSYVIKEL